MIAFDARTDAGKERMIAELARLSAGFGVRLGDVENLLDTVSGADSGGGGTTAVAVPSTRLINTTAPLSGGGSLASNLTLSLLDNGVSDVKLRDSVGLSVIGRAASTTGDPADVVASTDGDVLRRSGTTLGFGAIPESSVTGLVADLAARPTGSGTAGTVPLWTGVSAIGDSSITDTGSLVTVGNALTVTGAVDLDSTLNVDGAATLQSTLTLPLMTEGSVLFAGAGGLVSQNNANLFWDDADNHLCLGTAGSNSDNTAFAGGTVGQVEVSRDASNVAIMASTFGDSNYAQFVALRGRGTRAAPQPVLSGDVLGVFTGAGYGNTTVNAFSGSGNMKIVADANWTGASHPGAIVFTTVPSGSTNSIDRMRIGANGNVTIGLNTGIAAAQRLGVYSPGNSSDAAVVLKGQYYGLAVGSEQTSASYYAFNVLTGLNSGGGATWVSGGTSQFKVLTNGDTTIGSAAGNAHTVNGTLTCANNLVVNGSATLGNAAGDAHTVNGSLDLNHTLNVDGAATFQSTLTANGNVTIGNAAGDAHTLLGTLNANTTAGSNGQILQVSGGVPVWGAPSAASITTGTGTANTLVKWTGTSAQGDSSITDDGTTVAATSVINGTSVGLAGTTAAGYTLDATRGSSTIGGAKITGTADSCYFLLGANEDVHIRPGKSAGSVYVGDNGNALVNLGSATTQVNVLGTDSTTVFNYQTDGSGDIYLRGGKTGSAIIIGDVNTGGIALGATGNATTVLGTLTVDGNCTLGDADTDSHIVNGTLDVRDFLLTNYITQSDGLGDLTIESVAGGVNQKIYLSGSDIVVGADGISSTGNGNLEINGRFETTNEIAPAQITSDQNNYSPTGFETATVLILTSDAARNITGFDASSWSSAVGRHVWVYNNGSFNITLKHNDGASSAGNKVIGPAGADVVLVPNDCVHLYLSSAVNNWIVLSAS